MNCKLPWNLKDMTGIPADKLQKNIGKQVGFMELYRNELLKEALGFNIASLLSHVCRNRQTFGTDDLSKCATDCLVTFLHAASFLKKAFFTPTDVENPGVPKCCRNLHRLMLENVKATMRYLDYKTLYQVATGEVSADDIENQRDKLHNSAFPQENIIKLCENEKINDGFYTLSDNEMNKAQSFLDFEVQRNALFDEGFCLLFSRLPRQDESLPESEYGIIGSSLSYLEKPFIKYGNSFYSFVTAYSFDHIKSILDLYLAQEETKEPEVEEQPVEEEAIPEEPVFEEDEEFTEEEEPVQGEDYPEEPVSEEYEEFAEEEPVEETVFEDDDIPEEPVFEEDEEFIEEDEPLQEEEYLEEPVSEEYEEFVEEEEPVEETVFEDDDIPEEPMFEEDEEFIEEPAEEEELPEEPVFEEEEKSVEEPAQEDDDTIKDNIMQLLVSREPQQIITGQKEARPSTMDDIFDDDDFEEIITEEQEYQDSESAYTETDEYEYPDEFEEDNSNSYEDDELDEEDEVYEIAEEDQVEPEEVPQPEEDYSQLETNDAYKDLDTVDPSTEYEKMIEPETTEILEDVDLEDSVEAEEVPQEETDEPDPYDGESLFSIFEDEDPVEEPVQETVEEEKEPEVPVVEEPVEEPTPEPEPEPVEEPIEEETVEEEPDSEPEPEPVEEEEVFEEEPAEEEIPVEEKEPEPVEEEVPVQEEPVEEPTPEPESTVLPLLEQILKFAPSSANPIAVFLKGCAFQQQKELVRFIETARRAHLQDGKDKMFAIPDTDISVALFSPSQDPMIQIQRRENIGAVMYAKQKDHWNSLELCFDNSGSLVGAAYNRISRMSFSDWEWKIVEKLGKSIMQRSVK